MFDVRQPFFACVRTELEYPSQRCYRASSFPSRAGNRRNIGPPTEAHEDMFTGPQHTLTLKSNRRFSLTIPTDGELQFTLPDVLKVLPA
jgi:hypothetical protein